MASPSTVGLLHLPDDVLDKILRLIYLSQFEDDSHVNHLEKGWVQNVESIVSLLLTCRLSRTLVGRHLSRAYDTSTLALIQGYRTGCISRQRLITLTLRRLMNCSRRCNTSAPHGYCSDLELQMKENSEHYRNGLCTHVYEDGSRCFNKRAVLTRSRSHSDMKCHEHVLRPDPHRWDWLTEGFFE